MFKGVQAALQRELSMGTCIVGGKTKTTLDRLIVFAPLQERLEPQEHANFGG